MADDSKSAENTKWLLGTLGLGALASAVSAVSLPSPANWAVAFVILLLLVLLVGGYLWLQSRRNNRREAAAVEGFAQETQKKSLKITDPKQQAKADELQQKLSNCVEMYRKVGLKLTDAPFFLIIGESSSGKTEAIRRAGLSLTGGTDPMSGTGGTENMDWWFTKDGVIIDTAGKMVFPEVLGQNVSSPLWKDLLTWLKKVRPDYPINGLMLVLSADDLIRDNDATITKRPLKIAQQFKLIQDTLGIRFPVTVLVTKCDLLVGFREFFVLADNDELKHQMIGWSNPATLEGGTTFEKDWVEKTLGKLTERLRKRRLGLLINPRIAGGSSNRHADKVDALFALPKSLSLITGRLQRYLDTIINPDDQFAKPPFLRGIYFTSAMRIGTAVDEAVDEALRGIARMGGAAQSLPQVLADAKSAEARGEWEKALVGYSEALKREPGNAEYQEKVKELMERMESHAPLSGGFFLKDLLLEKVFKEKGLVTPAANVKKELRRRQLALIGIPLVCLLVVLVVAGFGWAKWNRDIGSAEQTWSQATGWTNRDYQPIVLAPNLGGRVYQLQATNTDGKSLTDFHRTLRAASEATLSNRWFFFLDNDLLNRVSPVTRKQAQRIVFERGVVLPLIENTRAKMKEARSDGTSDPFETEALKALIRIEADLARGPRSLTTTNPAVVATNYLNPLLSYLTETNCAAVALQLAGVFQRTYQDLWPAGNVISGGNSLTNNLAISNGLDRFCAGVIRTTGTQALTVSNLATVRLKADEFGRQETNWYKTATSSGRFSPPQQKAMVAAKTDLDRAVAAAKANGVLIKIAGFATGLTRIREDTSKSGESAISWLDAVLAEARPASLANDLFQGISQRLAQTRTNLTRGSGIPDTLNQEAAKAADTNFLDFHPPGSTNRHYEVRFHCYTQAYAFYSSQPSTGGSSTLLLLSDLTSQAEKILEEAKTYATSNSSTPILYPICKSLVEQGFLIRFSNLVVTQLISFERESPSPAGTNLLRRAHDFVTGASNELKSATNVLTERKPQSLQASLTKAIDATRSKLIEKYVQQTFSNLNQKAGFPMVKDGTNVMTANEVVQFARDVNALQAASTSEVVQSYPHTGQLAALRSALSNLVPVVLACVTNDSLQTFLLSINDTKEQCYLYLEVESQSVTNCGNISDKKLSLAPCGVDSKLVFNSRLTKDRPIAYTNRIGGSWGAFRLLTGENYKATRVTNGPTWKVVVQNGPDATNLIAVELVFQSPLPELKDWPRMTNLQAILPQSH